jgi:nucleotide-binding universal stress UspA family protein
MTFERILVATDFSVASLGTVDAAVELAEALGASVLVVHAFQVPAIGAAMLGGARLAEAIEWSASEELRRISRAHADRRVRVEGILRRGVPREQIKMVAEQAGVDLIVLGAHDRARSWTKLLHGNVATTLARSVRAPVLTIRDRELGHTACLGGVAHAPI